MHPAPAFLSVSQICVRAAPRLEKVGRNADTPAMAIAALSFQPIFLYISVGLSALIGFARLLLGWALSN
jgi:hypothetical protein